MVSVCERKGKYYVTWAGIPLRYCPFCAFRIMIPFLKTRKEGIDNSIKWVRINSADYKKLIKELSLIENLNEEIERDYARWKRNGKMQMWKQYAR